MKSAIFATMVVLTSCATTEPKPKTELKVQKQFIITPMNEDNEGRPLFTLRISGDTTVYDYMYAEEVVASMIRDTIVVDEMLHLCDNLLDEDDCWKNQVK